MLTASDAADTHPPESDEDMADDDMIAKIEKWITAKLQHRLADQPIEIPPIPAMKGSPVATATVPSLDSHATPSPAIAATPTPAATPPTATAITDPPVNSATTLTTKPASKPPHKPTPLERRQKHRRPAKSSISFDEQDLGYDFKTGSSHIIQFRTDTSHIRSH